MGDGVGDGTGLGDGVGEGVGLGVGDGVGEGVGDGSGLTLGLGTGDGSTLGEGSGDGLGNAEGLADGKGDGSGFGVPPPSSNKSTVMSTAIALKTTIKAFFTLSDIRYLLILYCTISKLKGRSRIVIRIQLGKAREKIDLRV